MELKLEVVLSSSIKRKKPWPRFCWLGQEKESVFLLDDKRISEINIVSGRTKKRTPKLQPLLNSVVTMASSHNGVWLCGLLVSGQLFLWNRDKDLLKTAAAAPDVVKSVTAVQGNAARVSLHVSGDGMRVLVVVKTGQVFLWECVDFKTLMGMKDGTVKGQWGYIQPLEDSLLPSLQDKEASHHTLFIKTEAMGDACLTAFVFTSGKKLIITFLKIHWEEFHSKIDSVGYSVQWATKTYPLSCLTPPCQSVKSRGALVPGFSPDGLLLAIVLNQRQPKATQVLFVSTKNFVSISRNLGGCGSKNMQIPSKYIRSYWVGSVSWSPDSLFLACVLKRGSLLMLARLGELLTLSSTGCSVDFGPAHFLPLHPLVTYRPTGAAGKGDASLSSSSLSVRDVLRQRYSVTWHPRLLYFIVSDGYMATVMRVLGRPSPGLVLKTLLKDASKDLERAGRFLDKSQADMRAWLESVSVLNPDSSLEMFSPTATCEPKPTDCVLSPGTDRSTLPLFLQDSSTLGGTKELLEKVQAFFEDDSDLDGPPVGSHVEDGGRLEFASMFDTLHALQTHNENALDDETDFHETERKTHVLRFELPKIQNKLLTAWALGVSLGNTVEHRTHLLKQTVHCVVRFAALLHFIPASVGDSERKYASFPTHLLHLLKGLLTFLPWDSTHSDGPHCLGLVVDLCKRLVRLLLSPPPNSYQPGHCQLSSQMLSTALLILQMAADSLDHTYSLQQRTFWSHVEKESHCQPSYVWSSDVHYVPLLQNEKVDKSIVLLQAQPSPQRPSSRLFGVWQWLYKITQQYIEELTFFKGCNGWEEEQQQLLEIMSQIQTALQATGEKLDQGPTLLDYPGEHYYLCGSFPKSADVWRSQICDESNKSCERNIFQETRLCLALLYSLLSQYRLREAQELGDHMACLILPRAAQQKDNVTWRTESLPCPWLPIDLHSGAACAVVQTLGRFMASYFTNQPLYIFPPHNVAVLPPLHLPHASSVGRLVPLCQQEVSKAVRQQHLSEVWTVEYALDLLLLGGLLPESVWLAHHLGDWKTAVSLSLAYKSYCSDYFDFTQLKWKELHLPTGLDPESIFWAEFKCHLGNMSASQDNRDKDDDRSFTDPLEGEDWDLLQVSIQDILKASVMARVNVLCSPLSSLLDTARDLCSSLAMLVPSELYLPSPPLYCPQPSPNTQDQVVTQGQFAEVALRHKVSSVLQRLLLLLRSARCCLPAAQWYISRLRRARHILHKIKKKYCYPSAAEEEKIFPEGLLKFVTRSGFFRQGPNKDGHLDPDSIQIIICFRELCGLCWMLHVRDQLSISCRKYQAARQHSRDEQISKESKVRSTCTEALHWACRFLPFSHYLSAEEILQDVLLSLVSELPPVSLVADILVHAFPDEEESVKVSLREKYNSLLHRLRQCKVIEGGKDELNESMMVLIQDKRRQRRKHLKRLQRHLAPPELHLWEEGEEVEVRGPKSGTAMFTQLLLGTSLSTSTLTDCGFPPLCSDGDTEAISSEQHCTTSKKSKKVKKKKHANKTAVKMEGSVQEETQTDVSKSNEQPSLPVVGTWEFELEDEEYLNFLELFLSYVLEKDSTDGGDPGSELPLLKGYSSQLRERELHSLTFDVLTTVHRRQRDGHQPGRKHCEPPVFRAGCCYKPITHGTTPEPQNCSVWSAAPSLSVSSLHGLRTGKQHGLFGLPQKTVASTQSMKRHQSDCETRMFDASTSVEHVPEVQQGLDPKLEAQFPELGRLLEWMVRWSDRKVLLGHHQRRRKESGGGPGAAADEGVVIRVKASSTAVLTSLSLLQCRYAALLESGGRKAHIQVPDTQWTVSPVLQPVVDRKLERESSVDTGYPGSAYTPIAGLEHNLQQELSIGSHSGEPEESTCPRTPPHSNYEQLTPDAQRRQSSLQQPSLGDLDVTPEKEGKNESEGLEASSSVSHANICTPEASLKLADLDVSENADDTTTSITLHSQAESLQAPPHPEPQARSFVQPEALVHPELSHSSGGLLPNTASGSPNVHPQTSTAGEAAAVFTASNQPLPTDAPPLRQRLGEDLFRLVQHINHMSLMEVLGASFSSLQLAQQSSSLAQSYTNLAHPNVLSSYVTNSIPQPNGLPVQTPVSVTPQTHTHAPNSGFNNPQFSQHGSVFADLPAAHSSVKASTAGGQHHTTRQLPTTANSEGIHYQEIQPLSVQAESPSRIRESKTTIPSSQGLLNTTDLTRVIPTAPVVLPKNSSIQKTPAPQPLSLKLLQLHTLPQSASNHPVAQGPWMLPTENHGTLESHQHKHSHQHTLIRATEERGSGSSVPREQISDNLPHPLNSRNCQPLIQISERPQLQKVTMGSPVSNQNLPLLHFKPVPQSQVTFPKLPIASSSSPSTFIPAPMGEMPMIKLLYIEPSPKMKIPVASPSTHMTSLISMEQLTSSVIRRHGAEDARLQLLHVDPPTESLKTACTPSYSSSKRRKRREEKARRTEVTFRPDDSIILAQEPTEEPRNKEPAAADQMIPGQDITFQLGSLDSVLTGQRLIDKAVSTSIELHAFASTCKSPPECHDAFTNTESVSPPKVVDKAVSVSVTLSGPESQSPGSFQIVNVKDKEGTLKRKQNVLDTCGRKFISVLDLEDERLNQELPPSVSQRIPDPVRPPSPTSAQLHVLAASVIRGAGGAADKPQPSYITTQNLLQPSTEPALIFSDVAEEVPSLSHIESNRYSGPVVPQEVAESFDSKISQVIKSQSAGPHRAASTPPAAWFSSHLSELDVQLNALQKIADCLEADFHNSRMLVNTIEKLTSDPASDVKIPRTPKKTVRLLVPQEAWAPQPDILTEQNLSEDEETNQEEEYASPQIKPSFHHSTHLSTSQSRAPSFLHTPLNQLNEASVMSEVGADENVSQNGLSDTAEILEELVKEGYLSATDLDFSTAETSHRSRRPDQQRNRRMSQSSVLPEDQRRELRVWMRRKQRERLAVYQKHRESLRERERKPFTPSKAAKSATRNPEAREEDKRFKLLEQYNQRTSEACSLVSGLSQPEGAPVPSNIRSASAPRSGNTYRPRGLFINEKVQSGQTQSHRPLTADVQGWPSEDYRRRLGLHRPVTVLPRDRLSQVTRRGMLTQSATKNMHAGNQVGGKHGGYQKKTQLNKGPWTAGGTGIQRDHPHVEMRKEENLWESTSEINRLLDLEELESNVISAGPLEKQNDGSGAGASGMDWLDNLSEESTLSKIDWAAIEHLVATEDD
ncbi:ciliogenesis and planar polarity effector 1 [Betta splendens]|uniref:Ciliogenesis and planar polarity effector 1 n=1 Tax=Betta splendens TaxID=158456 RepID=A0A6P7P5F6_BETSP|nr:ciliogenesis and planar polarity effector 1 [Betta splendens]